MLDMSGAASGGGGSTTRDSVEEGRRHGIQQRSAGERGLGERKSGWGGINELGMGPDIV
jgi:hypothetical protein